MERPDKPREVFSSIVELSKFTGVLLLAIATYQLIRYRALHPEVYIILLVIYVGVVLIMLAGINKHERVLRSHKLRPLKKLGFEIENKEDYWGYKGIYKGYFIRIYYHPDGQAAFVSDPLVFIVYYNGKKADFEKLYEQYNRMNYKWFYSVFESRRAVLPNCIIHYKPLRHTYVFWQVKRTIDQLVDIAQREQLAPLYENDVDELIEEGIIKTPGEFEEDIRD